MDDTLLQNAKHCYRIYPSLVCVYRFFHFMQNIQLSLTGVGDVWFSLRNEIFQNNSLVTLEDIGESDDDALLCRTNLTTCCKIPYGPSVGNWFLPNGSRVPSNDNTNTAFYRTRGKMAVYLKHTGGGVEGNYRCEIPDLMNVIQTMYIGVYTSVGEWHCLIHSILLNYCHTVVRASTWPSGLGLRTGLQ